MKIGYTPINLSKLDFKFALFAYSSSKCATINLSKLDFKLLIGILHRGKM